MSNGLDARDAASPSPLSFTQERLWLLDRLDHGSAHYVMPCAFRVRGAIDDLALGRAFDALVLRHASLRTTFGEGTAGPFQRVHEPRTGVLQIEGIPDLDEATVAARAAREALRVTDLEAGPLFSALLLRASPRDAILLLHLHHIVGDGWSLAVMTEELSALYAASRPLPPLTLQYTDFARRQRAPANAERVAGDIAFWRSELAGAPPELDFPTDRPRPPVQTFHGATVAFALPTSLSRAILELSARCDATVFATLLAAYGVFLGRHAGQSDVVVGVPAASRARVELETLVGFFANSLPLRITFSEDVTVRDLVGGTHDRVVRSLEHQDVPFAALVGALAPARTRARSPVFQTMFSFENMPEIALTLGQASVTTVAVPSDSAKFELTLVMRQAGPRLDALFEYRTDLFDRATIERLRDRFLILLEELTRTPERRLREIAVLPPSELRLLESIEDGGALEMVAPEGETVFTRFRDRATAAPDAVAILCGDERVTYGELLARSSFVASRLLAIGLEVGEPVAMCLERSASYVAAILGVWQSGGCYVPIDPSSPPDRVRAILRDARPRIGIHGATTRGELEGIEHAIDLTPLCRSASTPSTSNVSVSARTPAYVIYTSGSTGTPKGVAVHHGALLSLLAATRERVFGRVQQRLVVGVVASFHFDASVEGLVRLADGDTLVLVSEEERIDPDATLELVRRHGIDVLDSSPSLLRLLLASAPVDRLPKAITVGNEAIDPELWSQARALPATRVVNVYGPTETTVEVTSADLSDVPVPVIGRPLPGCRCYVLDEQGRRVPIGVAGELCVGGAQVALGYLNRPAESVAKFVADPFASERDRVMYKTGDRARWREDGNIEYLGRIDRQIKIRGYRIEPGEIESALRAHPAVDEVAVEARAFERSDKQLVAWVSSGRKAAPTADALRSFLRARVPGTMIPSHFVTLEELPRTPSGKIDRERLPTPGRAPTSGAAPRTRREQIFARIWVDLLGLSAVGVDDNFFELGGHSLLAAEMVRRVRSELDPAFALKTVFERPTIAELAASGSSPNAGGEPSLVRMNGRRAGTPVVLVHPLSGDVTCYRRVAGLVKAHPVYAIRSGALDGPAFVESSLDELSTRYARLVHSEIEGPFILGGWSAGGVFAHAIARACLAAGRRDVLALVLVDTFCLTKPTDGGDRAYLIEVLLERGRADDARTAETCDPSEVPGRLASVLEMEESRATTLLAVHAYHVKMLRGYLPEPIAVPVRLLRASRASPGEPRWGERERRVAVRGDHFGCIGEYAADVAAELSIVGSPRELSILR